MTEIEFQSLVLEKLSSIDLKLWTVETSIGKIETRLWTVEKSVWTLEKSVWNLETSLESLRDEFIDFKSMTQEEFLTTRKLIKQAFDKISDNITYQDKITKIEEILKTSRRREFA